ncbi:hypothetical protein WA1_50590 [Scytonema hofmannii PCC 7110]|uniref:Uncharacterized protein n=1 Tax=Scytonema hofmannii PCC 7110 TaxID=128403 RepID=A0A139WQF9_9CYAN|nr:hypothetical protein [Scytonema hofmannii]KYC34667.1 hypothetical protein WA1_50590 [Scytonema hofmannii PCC 7110]
MSVKLLADSSQNFQQFQILHAPTKLLAEFNLKIGDFVKANCIHLIINHSVNLGYEVKISCQKSEQENPKYSYLIPRRETELLLDRPFEHLTHEEWKLLKQYKPEIKIDTVNDIFGELYRIWEGIKLIGTFYQNLEGFWVSQPCYSTQSLKWLTKDEAIASIINR